MTDMRKCCDYTISNKGKIKHVPNCKYRPPHMQFDPALDRQHLQDLWDFWAERVKDLEQRTERQDRP